MQVGLYVEGIVSASHSSFLGGACGLECRCGSTILYTIRLYDYTTILRYFYTGRGAHVQPDDERDERVAFEIRIILLTTTPLHY